MKILLLYLLLITPVCAESFADSLSSGVKEHWLGKYTEALEIFEPRAANGDEWIKEDAKNSWEYLKLWKY